MSDWREQAACRPGSLIDPELFWPDSESGGGEVALHICRSHCPVLRECDQWARTELTQGLLMHPCVAGGRRYTRKSSSRPVESPYARPSPAGCHICPPQPPAVPRLRRADCPECGRNIGLTGQGMLARHQPRTPSLAGTPRCPGSWGKP